MPCKGCGGNTFEQDEAQGNAFCVQCGVVFEENTLAQEVEFGEKSSGAAVLMGTFVSATQGRAISFGAHRRQATLESKEQSIANGRKNILSLATALHISERYVEAAQRYFNLALAYNFTRGRTTQSVAAACLYVACRMERTSHMLIDFSDVLQVNVFNLGNTFLKLVRELNLRLPLVDPSIYIHRFAAMLEFGDKTSAVAADALRLVQRMSRDWIQTGRRPAGICGACLLIAARMHNFRRSRSEVMRIVKIGDATIKRRLYEFIATPSGRLSMNEFQTVSLEECCDPPAFKHGKQLGRLGVQFAAASSHTVKDKTPPKADQVEVDENIENWTDIDDEEIERIFLDEKEVLAKTKLWEAHNKDYLEKQAERKRREAAGEKVHTSRPSKKRRKREDPLTDTAAQSPAEAAKMMLSTKKFSRKINYAVIDELFESDVGEPYARVKTPSLAGSDVAADMIKYEVIEEPGEIAPELLAKASGKAETMDEQYSMEQEEEEEEYIDEDEEDDALLYEQDSYNPYDEYND